MEREASAPSRIVSLDQFRGYTVLGMFFVNFASHFQVVPSVFRHHHTYCSYADTIMPQFFFAVGFAYRLTLLRRLETQGTWSAYARVARRILGLILVGLIIHHLDGGVKTWEELRTLGFDGFVHNAFQRKPFQTLTHIGITSLWVLPVIAARPMIRIAFAILSAALFGYLSQEFYYTWVMKRPGIDGGPLGFLTWTIPVIAGSLAYDIVASNRATAARLLVWGVALMLLGYGLSCINPMLDSEGRSWSVEPPFVPPPPTRPLDIWTMSQRAGSPSYQLFGAGLSMSLYAVFVVACDAWRLRLGVLDTLGTNALAAYIIHDLVGDALGPYAPRDAPWWYALAAFALFFAICYLFLRHLEKHRLFLRL